MSKVAWRKFVSSLERTLQMMARQGRGGEERVVTQINK